MIDGIDWRVVERPTPAQRRETAELEAETAQRGHEADLIGAIVDRQAYLTGRFLWDYWDKHVVIALAQHARVLGLDQR